MDSVPSPIWKGDANFLKSLLHEFFSYVMIHITNDLGGCLYG
jgi:hypothetical protein